MAFNLATFKTRALTAIVFVIMMVGGIIMNQWSFFILFSIIHFGCWFEYQKLVKLIDVEYTRISTFHKFGVMILGWCVMLLLADPRLFGWDMAVIGKWLGLALLLGLMIEPFFVKNRSKKYLAHSIFGLLYISLSLALFVKLPGSDSVYREGFPANYWQKFGWHWPAFILGCMWINDTMAYIVGSFIGKTPFSKISPKKTWEGTIGGIILCAGIVGFVAYRFLKFEFQPGLAWWIVLAGIAAIAGTLGDLLESKLKRLAAVKDSGSIMPGHGGFLDRFDSLLIAAPVVWLFFLFFLINNVT